MPSAVVRSWLALDLPLRAGSAIRERRNVDPGAAAPALEPELRQLHALGALAERPRERRIGHDVAQEQLPLRLEPIVVTLLPGHRGPAGAKIDRLIDVGVPDRARRVAVVLRPALAQAGH